MFRLLGWEPVVDLLGQMLYLFLPRATVVGKIFLFFSPWENGAY
jgi:hypothetical protein